MKQSIQVFSLAIDGLTGHRPFEDAHAVSVDAGACVVADGVGLWEGIEYTGRYPRHSGSARIARAFCRGYLAYAKKSKEPNILNAFRMGNIAAARVNRGRSKYDVFRKHNGLFAATGAMTLIRGNVLTWSHLCDAGVAVIGKDGVLRLHKDTCPNSGTMPKDASRYDSTTQTFIARTILRNAIGIKGDRIGYGVITGEPEAEAYLETGTYHLKPGDTVLVFSDGFAPYVGLESFRTMIAQVDSEKEFRKQAGEIVAKHTAYIQKKLKGKKIDWMASVDDIQEKIKKILGSHAKDFEWAKEKTILVVRRVR